MVNVAHGRGKPFGNAALHVENALIIEVLGGWLSLWHLY